MCAMGFDVGTYNLITSRRGDNKEIKSKKEVNCFLELPLEHRFMFNMLKQSGVPIIERDKVAYVIGQAAVDMAYTLPQIPLRRPMSDGCLNPKEKDAFRILSIMMHSLIGEVESDKETIYYSVPANAINQETDADYHASVLQSIFKAYKVNNKTIQAFPINEGLALIFAELATKNYTGVGISCLLPGNKIYTQNGFVNIEDIEVGDAVLTHKGRWRHVLRTVAQPFKGKVTKIKTVSSTYSFVKNHKLYVKNGSEWKWKGCEEIEIGDVVGEPIIKQDNSLESPVAVLFERTTCSKYIRKETHNLVGECQRLLGYFLGDGSVNLTEGCIQFDFKSTEIGNIEDVINLLKFTFGKEATQTKKGLNCTRIKCYSKSLATYFQENFYDENKNKVYPFDLSRLNNDECAHLLSGLIRSDGHVTDKAICFGNTNVNLAVLAKMLFQRCGMPAGLSYREPRVGGVIDGRQVVGKKGEWQVVSGNRKLISIFAKTHFDKTITPSEFKRDKRWMENGFVCSRVTDVEFDDYEGLVYDLTVNEDSSFVGNGLTIANCGAGMINLCYSIFSQPVFQMSLVNSGDWIDKMAAKACGENPTIINKEKTKINLSKYPTSLVERAIKTQFELLVQKTVSAIKKAIIDAGTKAHTEQPLDIILGGGTASPPGFVELFAETIKESKWPIPVGEVKKPNDHLYSVARGCLIAAENAQG